MTHYQGIEREEISPAPTGYQTHNPKSFALQRRTLLLYYNCCYNSSILDLDIWLTLIRWIKHEMITMILFRPATNWTSDDVDEVFDSILAMSDRKIKKIDRLDFVEGARNFLMTMSGEIAESSKSYLEVLAVNFTLLVRRKVFTVQQTRSWSDPIEICSSEISSKLEFLLPDWLLLFVWPLI